MEPLYLFKLASQQARWASVRQAAITGNIANADTPGYKAVDVVPFNAVLEKTHLSMTRTRAGHIEPSGGRDPVTKVGKDEAWDVTHSGNSVSLEQEMLKAAEVNRTFTLNNSIVRSFHRMVLASVKS
ncbi:flagellar basal body rod protein FlgB [Aquabacter sediminis]|uniref:flagellar basal body rod protein FlgB n=1 Tax=Aquabacter sediminis TaxID=3029197 RepID=UPI00237D487C|nr:flagellar basal body rod protein FlgB [Aquabacter sp. P-9]MDE1571047.1 flagellar basal body rod protein FlgB [Aquabacter sp. P-9]